MASSTLAMAVAATMLLAGAGTSAAGVSVGRQTGAASAGRAARPDAVPFPHLNAISCPTASLCLVVGAYGATRTSTHPYNEIWDGTGWRVLNTPGPAHAHELNAVSCASRTSCVAVGIASFSSPFADAWNGRSWRVLPAPSQQVGLGGISCAATESCVAVGSANGHVAAEQWDGTAWHVLTTPAIAGSASSDLASVSCVSAASCIAVGSYVSTSSGNPRVTLAEAWNGNTWTVLATPAVNPAGSVLSSVSCAGARCVAVGQTGGPFGPFSVLAEGWDGHSWTVLPAVVPPGALTSTLSAVSCGSGGSCIAVGGYRAPPSAATGLAESWNGSTWKITKTPTRFTAGSVSCPAAASCMAVGGTHAERWNGSAWRGLRTLRFDSLANISCTRRSRCMAVGGYVSPSGRGLTLAERWNGRSWQVRAPRTPARFRGLSDVSCVGAAFCMAVGASGVNRAIAEQWNGHRWRLLAAPPIMVTTVSCSSPTQCMAVGRIHDVGVDDAAVWNGTRWRLLAVVMPKAFTFFLNDVSCPATNRCIAVGFKTGVGRADHALAEGWNGSRWRILNTHLLPAGHLNAVDCTGSSSCMAVGSGEVNGSSLVGRWTGRIWRALKTPSPVGLADVSCVSASDCLGVGSSTPNYFGTPIGPPSQIAERWNGRRWELVRTPMHLGALLGVSCVRGLRCIAVGQAGGLNTRALAERWNGVRLLLMKPSNP